MEPDYVAIYNLEEYLLGTVGPRFRDQGVIEPFDYFAMLIWKANRAKTKHYDRLAAMGGSFVTAVANIATGLHTADSDRERLRLLMQNWGFHLPTASAILTLLYPDRFTVYDIRACNELGRFHDLAGKQFSERVWNGHQMFVEAVRATAPPELSLRDADRFLWGRSFYRDNAKRLGA